MKVQTSRFGEIEISESDVISMPQGLIGFPELSRFVILEHDTGSPFKWLQAIDDGTIAFVIMSPLAFNPNYVADVSEDDVAPLDLQGADDAVVCVIATIPSDPKKMTANLKAPIIFNLQNKCGRQVILKESEFHTKHLIIEEMKKHAVQRNIIEEAQQMQPSKMDVPLTQDATSSENSSKNR